MDVPDMRHPRWKCKRVLNVESHPTTADGRKFGRSGGEEESGGLRSGVRAASACQHAFMILGLESIFGLC